MAAEFTLLAAEFDRIINCPYFTQFKALHDIILTRCSTADIERWIQENRCRLAHVACLLLEGFQQWSYVGQIIARLSVCVLFRDAVLMLQPHFLDTVLEQAIRMEHLDELSTSLAVAMLSHPLPAEYMLPARVQTFFLHLVERASIHPTMATVRPLLDVLRGTSTLLLGLLSPSCMSRFEEQLFSILRSSTVRSEADQDDNCLTLYCLAVMKIVTEAGDEYLKLTTSSFDTQDLLASTQAEPQKWDAESMRKFFTKPKTLQLLVLRVMDAMRPNDNRALEFQINVLLLSNDLLEAIPMDLKASWCLENKSLLQRLEQKALAADLNEGLQLQTLTFLSQLPVPEYTLKQITKVAYRMLAQPETLAKLGATMAINAVIRFVAGAADLTAMPLLLQTMLDVLSYGTSSEVIQLSPIYTRLLNQIKDTVTSQPKLVEAVTLVMISDSIASRLRVIAEMEGPKSAMISRVNAAMPECSVVWQNARSTVIYALSELLLSSIMASTSPNCNIPHVTMVVLLKLHAAHARPIQTCEHTKFNVSNLFTSMKEPHESQQPGNPSQDWRVALSTIFAARSRTESAQVVQIFQRACADLETRCETVEGPLRSEQKRCEELQKDYDELSKAYSELEAYNMSVNIQIEALETEKSEVLHDLKDARTRGDSLNDRLHELEILLEDAKVESQHREDENRSAVELMKLEHVTVMARVQEELDNAGTREGVSRKSLEAKVDEVMNLERELCSSKTANVELRNSKVDLEERLDSASEQSATLVASAEALQDRCTELETSLTSMRAHLVQQEETQSRELQGIQQRADQTCEENDAAHNAIIKQLTEHSDKEIDELKRQLLEIKSELKETNAHHVETIAQRDEKVAAKQQEVERLRRHCREKDDQITQANLMRTNLMAAMGIPQDQEAPESKLEAGLLRRRSSTSTRRSSQQRHPPSPADSPTLRPQHQSHAEQSFTSSHSSQGQSGPTPKRARPRPSIKRSTAKPSGHAKPTRHIASTSRPPLTNLSVNKSPRKSGLQPMKLQRPSARYEDLCPTEDEEAEEESTFAGSDIFTGTAAQAEVDELLSRQPLGRR